MCVWSERTIEDKVIGEMRNGYREVCPGDCFPLLTQASVTPADGWIRWPPADVEPCCTNNDIDLVVLAVDRLDAIRRDLGDTVQHYLDVVFA